MYRVPSQSPEGSDHADCHRAGTLDGGLHAQRDRMMQSSYFTRTANRSAHTSFRHRSFQRGAGTVGADMLNLLCARPYSSTTWTIFPTPSPSGRSGCSGKFEASAPQASAARRHRDLQKSSGTPGGRRRLPMPIGPRDVSVASSPRSPGRRGLPFDRCRPRSHIRQGRRRYHRTSMPIPGAECNIDHRPASLMPIPACGRRVKQVEDQFVSMVQALENAPGVQRTQQVDRI